MVALSFFGLTKPHTTSRLLGILTDIFSSENSLWFTTIAVPPPLFVSLGVEMYFNPSNWNIFSNSNCCFLHLAFSQTSENIATEIFLSKMSFLTFSILGISERTFETEIIGRDSPLINFLSLFITFLLFLDSYLSTCLVTYLSNHGGGKSCSLNWSCSYWNKWTGIFCGFSRF